MVAAFILDFESEATVDIKQCGAYAYSVHPDTDVMCLSWRLATGAPGTERLWHPGWTRESNEIPYELQIAVSATAIEFHAFNAFFESCFWANVMVKRYGWPEIAPKRWHCLAARSAYRGYSQNLARCAEGLRLPEDKDNEGHKIMMAMCRVGKRSKKVLADWDANQKKLRSYCKKDVEVEALIYHTVPPLPEKEEKIWRLDQQINREGLPFDEELVDSAQVAIDKIQKDARHQLPILTGGAVETPGQIAKIQKWANQYLPKPLDNLQAPTVEDLLASWSCPDNVREVLEIRQRAGTAAVKKFSRAKQQLVNGRARGLFVYYGAHTGRWTGKGTQPTNMPRLKYKTQEETEEAIRAIKSCDFAQIVALDPENPTNVLTKSVRPSVEAAPGKVFVASDFCGVELRGLTWLVDDKVALDTIRRKGSSQLYLDMAAQIYKRPISKEGDPFEYTCGKASKLGCGYQMGPDRFVEMAKDTYGVTVSLDLARTSVDVYRKSNPLTVQAWGTVKGMIVDVVKDGFPRQYRDVLKFRFVKGSLIMKLPSGRELFYPRARIEETKFGEGVCYLGEKDGRLVKKRLYGGLTIENATQALSRCLLVDSMLELARRGFQTVSHCYDEIVSEVDEDRADECLAAHNEILTKSPDWCKDLPLAIESWIGRRYRK